MNKIVLVFVFTIVLLSCKKDKALDVNLSDESLVALIQDMHVANTVLSYYKQMDRDSMSQLLRKEMAEIHNISEERIDFVMEQLQRSPKKYLELEKKAVENLKTIKDSLKKTPIKSKSSVMQAEKKR